MMEDSFVIWAAAEEIKQAGMPPSVFRLASLLQNFHRTSSWTWVALSSSTSAARQFRGGALCHGPHRNAQSAASVAQTSEQDLRKSLQMTESETRRICDNLQPVCEDPMGLLANPAGDMRFKRNLELMDGLGQEIWEMKRWLSGM